MKHPKKNFNQQNPSPKQEIKTPVSDKGLQDKIDNYSRTAEQDQFFFLQKLKNKYVGEQRKTDSNRDKQDLNYAMGTRKGFPQSPFEKIKEARNQEDQLKRQEVLKEAKEYYHDHHSLTKKFDGQKGKLFQTEYHLKSNFHKVGKDVEHHQMLGKIDTYQKVMGPGYSASLEEIKKHYNTQRNQNMDVRKVQDQNYSMGVRNGLPHLPHSVLQQARTDHDKQYRENSLHQVKGLYHSKEPMTKKFNQQTKTGPKR